MSLSRWEERAGRRAEEARREAPAGFDMQRLPWWLFLATGLVLSAMCVRDLLEDEPGWRTTLAVAAGVLVAAAQFVVAHRLRQRIPLDSPYPFMRRLRRQQ
jgi:hypothetical protein